MPFRASAATTVMGLSAATGMRAGEAFRLECTQIDWAEGVLTVHATKFGKSREVPLAPGTVQALAAYSRMRDQQFPQPKTPAFLVSSAGTKVAYPLFRAKLLSIVYECDIRELCTVQPR